MLDLTRWDALEPYEHDDYIIFSSLSTKTEPYRSQFAERVKEALEEGFSVHNIPLFNPFTGEKSLNNSYMGDYYLVADSDPGTPVNTRIPERFVRQWRYVSRDVIFHLTKYTWKDTLAGTAKRHWWHYICTNTPNDFKSASTERY